MKALLTFLAELLLGLFKAAVKGEFDDSSMDAGVDVDLRERLRDRVRNPHGVPETGDSRSAAPRCDR